MQINIISKAQGPTLAAYKEDWNDIVLIMGPVGSGKTTASCEKVFAAMCAQEANAEGVRPTRWLAVRNTTVDLKATTIKDWMEVYGDLGHYTGSSPTTHALKFLLEDGTRVESELIFVGLDNDDDIKKLKGTQLTGVWLNEISELEKSVFDWADGRHGRYPSRKQGVRPTWHGMLGDYNAVDDEHWLYKLAEEEKPEGWSFYRQPGGVIKQSGQYVPNPNAENLHNLPTNYYTNLMRGKKPDWIKVVLANEYGVLMDGEPVHPEYTDSIHCIPSYEVRKDMPITLGADFGRTPAVSFMQPRPDSGWVIFDEFCGKGMSAEVFAPELKRYIDKTYPDYLFKVGGGDPAGTSGGEATELTPFIVLQSNGINIVPAGTNDPVRRRAALSDPLTRLTMTGQPALLVTANCKMLRKGLAGGFCYKRIKVSGEKYAEQPDKNKYSHICEAAEYGLLMEGEGSEAIYGKSATNGQQTNAYKPGRGRKRRRVR